MSIWRINPDKTVRIYQVKEGMEGADTVAFINKLLTEKLGIPPDQSVIVAAHRSFTKKPINTEATPRSIVVRFLQWDTRQKVLQAAWAKKEITLGDTQIYFDRDYSAKVQQERSLYVPIRTQLGDKSVKSHIIYPAKLKVFGEGDPTVYESAGDAAKHLTELGLISNLPTNTRSAPKSTPFMRDQTHNGEERTVADLLRQLMYET